MPRVLFSADWSHVGSDRRISTRYRKGATYLLSQEAAKEAVAKGKGKVVPSPGETRPAATAAPSEAEPKRLSDGSPTTAV